MHTNTLIKRLLNIDKIIIENMYFEEVDEENIFVVAVRPSKRETQRCPLCKKKCQGYDSTTHTRRWRTLDFGSQRVYIEAKAPRVKCDAHGVLVAQVPWARHKSDYTYDFETAVTWLSLHATAKDVSEYFRIKWHTVGAIISRVEEDLEKSEPSRYDNLEAIGIDETSYKKGHKYMTVVVNHNTGRLIWAKKGYGKETLAGFFKELTYEQREKIRYVTADGARYITDCITEYCPNAERCVDPFHVVGWANDSLDEVRLSAMRKAKKEAAESGESSGDKKKKTPNFRSMPC